MAKLKNAEQAKEALPGLREDRKVASKEYKQYMKENGLKANEDGSEDYSTHEKHGKKWTKLRNQLNAANKAVEEAQKLVEAGKETKEKKSGGGSRRTQYTYPADMTPEEKKKFRAKKRAEAKKASKAESAGEEKPAKKKEKKGKESEETAAKAEAPAKKDKKKKEKSTED